MIDLLTTDGALAIFAAVGIVTTALVIARDAKAQKARVTAELVTEDVPVDYRRAA